MKKTGDVVKLGVAAGAAVAATKVAQKYNEIKEQTGGDVNGDGVVDIKDTIEGIKVAAKEVYDQAVTGVEAVKAKVQDPNFINEAKDAVMKKAGEVVEDVKDVANDLVCLQSYYTIVSVMIGDEAVDLGKWSPTTGRHQCEFRRWCARHK